MEIERKHLNIKATRFRQAKSFPHLEIKNFFTNEFIAKIADSLQREPFYVKQSDLFSFKQTADLISTKEPVLQELRAFLLSESFMKYMEQITGFKLKRNKLDLAGTMYEDTDYLLCHDDQLDKRKIAFLIYLSDMTAKEGGFLNIFGNKKGRPTKVVKKIIPKYNKFALFEVSKISFHSVEEVKTNKQRIAIGGWYYG
jgi:Rps23 Pro-64 3,4-dihydroxylase Tpa1-like proline 4-hydroxylase